jgi:hypothetical protein
MKFMECEHCMRYLIAASNFSSLLLPVSNLGAPLVMDGEEAKQDETSDDEEEDN